MNISLLYRSRLWLFYGPIMVLTLAALIWSWYQFRPLPPATLVIASGAEGENYTRLAREYRKRLESIGVQASLLSIEKISQAKADLLRANGADLVFANSLAIGSFSAQNNATFAASGANPPYYALAAIEREPIWIFTRQAGISKLRDLKGLKIGLLAGDPLQARVHSIIMTHAQLNEGDSIAVSLSPELMVSELIDGKINAAVMMGSIRNDVIGELLRSPGIQLIGVDPVGSMLNREPMLRPFVLPQGSIELRGDVPDSDLTMVSSQLHLLVKPDMHPALQRAILQAASQIHEIPNFLQMQGEFPSYIQLDAPISPVALEFANGKLGWLDQVLPYRWAQFMEWLLLVALPMVLLSLFAMARIPALFEWRIDAVLQHFYGELKFIETDIEPSVTGRPMGLDRLLTQLDDLERQVMQLNLPTRHADRWYTLRNHLVDARERALNMRAR